MSVCVPVCLIQTAELIVFAFTAFEFLWVWKYKLEQDQVRLFPQSLYGGSVHTPSNMCLGTFHGFIFFPTKVTLYTSAKTCH